MSRTISFLYSASNQKCLFSTAPHYIYPISLFQSLSCYSKYFLSLFFVEIIVIIYMIFFNEPHIFILAGDCLLFTEMSIINHCNVYYYFIIVSTTICSTSLHKIYYIIIWRKVTSWEKQHFLMLQCVMRYLAWMVHLI